MKIITVKTFKAKEADVEDIVQIVGRIISDVRQYNDKAVLKYAKQFDNFSGKDFQISKLLIKDAYKKVDLETITALKKAAKNIGFFAKQQLSSLKEFSVNLNGVNLQQKLIPID